MAAMNLSQVSAVIPTRGDVDLTPVLDTLPYNDVIVWDNSQREDMGPYGRFTAIAEAEHELIFTIDDDVIFRNHQALLDLWEPGKVAVNYQEPWDIPWHGRGAIFHRDLPDSVFARYAEMFPIDHEFRVYYADGIFSLLTDAIVVDLGYEDLPHGFAPGRLSTNPGWYNAWRPEIQRRAALLNDSVVAA